VLTLVRSLSSKDYVVDTIVSAHNIRSNDALSRARQIVPHITTAIDYVDQAVNGPRDVAFLPIYYALLNLAKIYILLGPRHADLQANRWHGAMYEGHAKNSHSLLTEEIRIRRGGALPLLYETLTGTRIRSDIKLRMADVYPYVAGVGAEYQLASGRMAQMAELSLSSLSTPTGRERPVVTILPLQPRRISRVEVKLLLSGFKIDHSTVGRFVGPLQPKGVSTFSYLRSHIRPFLLYRVGGRYRTPLSTRKLLWPEELPIILAFFHLGSVARYKPEFLAKLRDSRFWPMLLAAQQHSLFAFLNSFWSYAHQQSLIITHE